MDEFYRQLLLNVERKPKDIMKQIQIPKEVFKYRRFVEQDNNETFWKESLNGEMYFSLPIYFNSNDNNDCMLDFDEKMCKKRLSELTNVPLNKLFEKTEITNIWNKIMEQIKVQIREKIKIGCFTTVAPNDAYMWNCKEFGDKNKGYCIEYAIDERDYPDATVFLPVSYSTNNIDMTEVILDLMTLAYKNDNIIQHRTLLSNGYNFALSKLEQYKEEKEWRIIITENNWKSYFDLDNESKRDFSSKMKAIYLGADYNQLENCDSYKKYALKICEKRKIPLYEMHIIGGKLEKTKIN